VQKSVTSPWSATSGSVASGKLCYRYRNEEMTMSEAVYDERTGT
jgi:hypothetical protein